MTISDVADHGSTFALSRRDAYLLKSHLSVNLVNCSGRESLSSEL